MNHPMIRGIRKLSAGQRLLNLAKLTTMLSGALTILCAMLLVGWQVMDWIKVGIWNPYPLSSVVESVKGNRNATYVTASVDTSTVATIKRAAVEWLLGAPTIVPLLVVIALHLALYLYLAALEKE
jgi:hypothetical protein